MSLDRILQATVKAKAVDKAGLLAMFKKPGVDTSWAPTEAAPGASGPPGPSVA